MSQEAITFLVFHPRRKAPQHATNIFLEKWVSEIVGSSSQSDLCMRFFGMPDIEAIAGRITGRISDPYEQPRDTVILAFEKRRPVGYADITRFAEHAPDAEISLFVRSDRQRQGIGTAMLQEVLHVMPTEGVNHLEAYVHPENVKVREAFQKWSRMQEMRAVTFRKTFREGEVVYTLDLGPQKRASSI